MKKLKILFIIPNALGKYARPTTPHISVAYLSSYIISKGHEADVFDMRLDSKYGMLKKKIISFKPDFIGITVMSKEYIVGYELINKLKSDFDIPIIVGGPHASTVKEAVLAETKADLAAYGEGENTIVDILNSKPHKKVLGLIWRNEGKIVINPPRPYITDLDSLPYPAYDLFDLDRYLDGHKIRIVSSRGCPYNCIYCSIKLTMGKTFRPRSAENVYYEIKHWYDKGFKSFQFTDDNFTFDIDRADRICDLIISNDLKIKWDLRNGIRVDKINKGLLLKFKKAGCHFIAYGVESADQKVLNAMKKGIRVEQAEKAIQDTIDIGIQTSAFFIIGSPKDTYQSFLKSLDFAKKFDLTEVRFYNIIPYPGTELYDYVKSNNLLVEDPKAYLNTTDYWASNPVMETTEFKKEERKKAHEIAELYVMKLLLKKELGPILGRIGYFFWRVPLLRKLAMKPGIKIWEFIRKKQF